MQPWPPIGRDGVRKSSLLVSGREKIEIDNGEGENIYARHQRGTRETIFIIRTGRIFRPSNESLL
jgi:hypothetical protein